MKRWSYFLILIVLLLTIPAFANFEDFLKDVLVETQSQVIGTDEYSFAPGDAIIKKETYVVYYSGTEMQSGSRALLLTLFNNQGSILLKYPNPDIIQVKSFRLRVLGFDNALLRIKVLEKG